MGSANSLSPSPDPSSQVWCLCWQAAVGRDFLSNPSLARRIRTRLIDAHQRSERVLIDFMILPSEIHAVSQIRADDSVGSVARAVGNVVSRWVREAQPVRSPVLAGPYRAHRIESTSALREELRMLAWRSVAVGACKTPTHHPYAGLRIALGQSPAKGFDARPLLRHFGNSVPTAREALRLWISKRPAEQDRCAWELTHGLVLATGNVGPRPTMARQVEGAAASLVAAGGGYGIDAALDVLALWVGVRLNPNNPPDLHASSSHLAARGRALVACLARAHRLCSAASVARYFQRAKATLCEQMATCRRHPIDRLTLATPLRRILDEAALLRVSMTVSQPLRGVHLPRPAKPDPSPHDA